MQKFAHQAEVIESNHRHASDAILNVRQEQEAMAIVKAAQLDELASTVRNQHSQFTAWCGSMDENCTAHIIALRGTISKLAGVS